MTPVRDGAAGTRDPPLATGAKGAPGSRQEDPELGQKQLTKRHDMTWHDHLIMLLHIGASIEHALMVQYLYAAYSLGGEQVPEEYRPMVQGWQETILAVAREEMGHLLTVQNILTLLGAGANLNRENFPWDIQFYPFPFVLEPFSRGALACYVYAEMPIDEDFEEKIEITRLARAHAKESGRKYDVEPHPVGEIYSQIMALIGDCDRIPDSVFDEQSIRVQASWDDWGRGYQPDPRPLDAQGNPIQVTTATHKAAQFRAHVLIDQVATRTQALEALLAVSVQGEGPHKNEEDVEWSHFERFIKMFREYETIKDLPWSPARPVPKNPTTVEAAEDERQVFISSSRSRDWAELFNLRYRMLLTLLTHAFQVARVTRADEPSVRAVLMHRAFGEMYNLKTIAGILVRLPLADGGSRKTPRHEVPCAGPPFEMPYNLRIPPREADVWALHLDILGSADSLCKHILAKKPNREEQAYIEALFDLDNQTRATIRRILDGLYFDRDNWRSAEAVARSHKN